MPGESLPLARQRPCRRPSAFVVVALVLIAALAAAPARAQESRGSITGRVVDSSGGVLPGVSLAVVNTATNGTTTVVTNDTGVYTALYLIPGDYTVTATLSRLQERQAGRHSGARRRSRRHRHHAGPGRDRGKHRRHGPAHPRDRHRHHGPGHRRQAHLGDPARRRHGLRPDAVDSGRDVRALLRAAAPDGQRQPARHDRHRHHQQRVLDRRLEQRRLAGARGHPAAGRSDSGIQGRHRRLRRADRPHRRRQRQPRAQERHQPVQPRRLLLQSRRLAIGRSLRVAPQQHRQDDPRLQPLRRDRIRPDLQEQDVLHGVVREAAGRHRGVIPDLGADREDAAGRLLRAAGGRRADFRSAHGPQCRRRGHPRSVSGEHHSDRPAESDRAQHPAVLSGRQRGAQRRLAEQPVRRSAVDLRLQLPDGARRSPVVGRPAHLRPLAAQLPP